MVNNNFERFGKNDFDFKFNLELNSVLWGISVDRILPNDHLKDKIAKINAIMNHFFATLASLELLLCGKTFL